MAGGNVRPAAGGGRWVDVDPERLPAWLNRFAVNHGGYRVAGVDEAVRIEAGDGTTLGLWPPPGAAVHADLEEFIGEAQRPRRIGLLLARQGSVAVGIAEGLHLIESKVDTYYVQSRTAAGGWSQQRYARRRVNQARAAAESAADQAVRVLLPTVDRPVDPHRTADRPADSHNTVNHLAAVVTGGDRRTVEAILADPRLAPFRPLVADRFLAVGEPRRRTLEEAARLARQVRILVRDPQPGRDARPGS
ncbi:MAG: hypothetical protein IRY85_03805 [Micromonosporaceae bacterium]|nr:hypothetical protein [Micromonosporaceae bacterium]